MLVSPSQLVKAAESAGMKVPQDLSGWDSKDFPHWTLFCNVQLGRPVTWGNHWENAKIIAALSPTELERIAELHRLVQEAKLRDLGFAP